MQKLLIKGKKEETEAIQMSTASKDSISVVSESSEEQIRLQEHLIELKDTLTDLEQYHLSLLKELQVYDIEEINPNDQMKYKIDFI